MKIPIENIYTIQSYLDNNIVDAKRKSKDYMVVITMFNYNDTKVAMLTDGHHSITAALLDNVEPYVITGRTKKTLQEYISWMEDLKVPINIITGKKLTEEKK